MDRATAQHEGVQQDTERPPAPVNMANDNDYMLVTVKSKAGVVSCMPIEDYFERIRARSEALQ